MKNTITTLIAILCISNPIQSQTYSQTFENVNLSQLVADSGWQASGVYIGNSNKLSGTKELITQLLNSSTSSSTYLVTYFYKGSGTNTIQFEHVINNSSGKDIFLTVYAIDSSETRISTFSYTYNSASKVNSTWSFSSNSSFKLRFEWSGLKTSSGSTAGLDMIMVNKPAIQKILVPLPVVLLNFNASLANGHAKLKWTTISEENLSGFEVCRSTDGKNFAPIASVNANYISNEDINYSFTDNTLMNANSNIVYYKLKMINADGSIKMSNVSQVRVSVASATVSVYPNPNTEYVNVNLSNTKGSEIYVSIVDAYGKTIQNEMTPNNTIQFDVRNLESGIYFINILNSDGSTTSNKFIKR